MSTPLVCRAPALEPRAVSLLRPPLLQVRTSVSPELPFATDRPPDRQPEVSFGPQATPREALPDPAVHARALVLALLEVLSGRRPVRQLRNHLTEDAYERLAGRLHRARTAAGAVKTSGSPARQPSARTRIYIGRTLVCEPADGIAEVTVLAKVGARTRAVAVRLEGLDGRWRCPVLTVL
ncbi:Rv3235 family protein [Cryptosporangium minutisporangium]|uniref:3-hydroxyacyl-CoA dehydrogenase n=1 Tax=Cryptosporangium minutisporangium TaxID=113569 RepID=A0ABP6T2N7_9ACTN